MTTTTTTPAPSRTTAAADKADATKSIPYQGDDWAQNLARTMALPLLAMGLMAVAGGLAAGIVGGVNFGDFFAPGGEVGDLGRAEAAVQVAGATLFLGMGLILGGITMTLVNVVRNLRDAGRDVQESLGAQPLQLRKPLTGKLTPLVMMMGVMIEVVAFAVGLVAAFAIGGVDPAAIADPAVASAGDLGDIGFVRAVSAWLPGLRLLGVAVILGSITLTLTTIRSAIRFQSDRITELAHGA
ncbi:MAG: hypothetical protein U5R31_08510 [Acidimicrobiia bacterium]|nr:hypothetical protein [Acidimicrobiia bacterium]